MTNRQTAPASLPPADEHFYQSFYTTLASSARGQAFLAEYARRNRHADTQTLLAALDRLEALVRADGAALARLRDQLQMLLIAIRIARPEINAASPPAKTAKLAALLQLLESRIDAMTGGEAAAPAEAAEAARAPLSVVPASDEPELPIPTPAIAPLPPIALVRDIRLEPAPAKPEISKPENSKAEVSKPDVSKTEPYKMEPIKALPGPDPAWRPIFDNGDTPTVTIMPGVDFIGGTVAAPAVAPAPPPMPPEAVSLPPTLNTPLPSIAIPEPMAATAAVPPPVGGSAAPATKAQSTDALLAIMALSEAERIALFT